MPRFQANRRVLALLAAFFFATTLYFCTTRLSAMDLIRKPLREVTGPAVHPVLGSKESKSQAELQAFDKEDEADDEDEKEKVRHDDASKSEEDHTEEEETKAAQDPEEEEKDEEIEKKKKEEEKKEEEKKKEEKKKEEKKEEEEKEKKKQEEKAEEGQEDDKKLKDEEELQQDEETSDEKHEKAEGEEEVGGDDEEGQGAEGEETKEDGKQDQDKSEEGEAAGKEDIVEEEDEEAEASKHVEEDEEETASSEELNEHKAKDDKQGRQDHIPHGLLLHAALPEELVPTLENDRRLLIIGDIHGMLKPLRALLRKADFDPSTDHIISVGDMINKGPSSSGVVALLMKHSASAVRGNHEDRILRALNSTSSSPSPSSPSSSSPAKKADPQALETAQSLSEEQVEWLETLPAILSIEPLRMHIVHAGMLPGVKPERQSPWAVMNMRTLLHPHRELRRSAGSSDTEGDDEPTHEKRAEEGGGERKVEEGEEEDSEHAKDVKEAKSKKSKKRSTEIKDEAASSSEEAKDTSDTKTKTKTKTKKVKKENKKDHGKDKKKRSADADSASGLTALDTREGEKWARAWNRYQRHLSRPDRWTVVYGHDARRGLREDRYTIGLDSGCVKGGSLTGLVVEGAEGGSWRYRLVQVGCEEEDDDEEDEDEDDE